MNNRDEARAIASALFDEGRAAHDEAEYERAVLLFSKSLAMLATAEAYTYRGWSRSFLGQLHEAIEDCLEAIHIDPDFGSPYNDIGAYLIELGRGEEAIVWLEKAIKAPRYEARCYPYMNLGRIHFEKGEALRAISYFRTCLALNSNYQPARRMLEALERRIN